MSWDNGGILDTMYEVAEESLPDLFCKDCPGVIGAPVESAENGYYGDGNVWCCSCGHSWKVSKDLAEYARDLEEEFVKAGF